MHCQHLDHGLSSDSELDCVLAIHDRDGKVERRTVEWGECCDTLPLYPPLLVPRVWQWEEFLLLLIACNTPLSGACQICLVQADAVLCAGNVVELSCSWQLACHLCRWHSGRIDVSAVLRNQVMFLYRSCDARRCCAVCWKFCGAVMQLTFSRSPMLITFRQDCCLCGPP